MPIPLTAAVLLAAVLAAAPARAGDSRPPASDADGVAAFLLRAESGAPSFVSEGSNHEALEAAARSWAARSQPGRVAGLASMAVPGSNGESRLVRALSRWTGAGRIAASREKDGAVAFLEDAAAKAETLLSDPRVRQDAEAALASSDPTGGPGAGSRAAIERARLLRERRGGGSANVFGPDRTVQDLPAGGSSGSRTAGVQAAGGGVSGGRAPDVAGAAGRTGTRGAPGFAPAAQLPLSQGRPDSINVPAPGAGAAVAGASGGEGGQGGAPNDGRVAPAKPMSAWERIKDSVSNPLSDAYGFTFEGLEPRPVSFRQHAPALAYARKAKAGAFSHVILYGHGAPGYMTVGEWGGEAWDISSLLKGKMRAGSLLEIKGCNTSSVGGMSVNPGRGLSSLTRRVLYFSIPYLSEGRDEGMRKQLEGAWNSDLARDTSRGLPGVKVCGFRTFGLVGDRIPVVGTLMGRREATDSNAILGSKACFIDGKEVGN